MRPTHGFVLAFLLLHLAWPASVLGQEAESAPPAADGSDGADGADASDAGTPGDGSELGTGLLSGPRWGRPPLTGDWFGVRRELAEQGFTFHVELVNIVQSVESGGLDEDLGNNGSIYLESLVDTGRAGFWPGGFLEFRAEKS